MPPLCSMSVDEPARPAPGMAACPAVPSGQSPDLYGRAYQLAQAEKYRNRAHNHWKHRIAAAMELTDRYVLPRLAGRDPSSIRVVDVGCSIGTFAIEFARRGFDAVGVDFDREGLAIAGQFAREEGVAPRFLCGDIADMAGELGAIDIAVCFDIFEHMMDDELGALLHTLRRSLSPGGAVVFHTFPTQFEYLFHDGDRVPAWGLRHFAGIPPESFERVARAFASIQDAAALLTGGQSHADRIERSPHCNPLTERRLRGILGRAGLVVDHIGTADLFPQRAATVAAFGSQPVTHRNLFGVASRAV